MRADDPHAIRLADYRPPEHLVDRVDLDIRLHPTETIVRSTLAIRPNPAGTMAGPLVLDGDNLVLASLAIDGLALAPSAYSHEPERLVIHQPPTRPFLLTIETHVDPTSNSKLMGLYRSSGTYCTQCEADGFRRITFYPDRPDVMARFRVRLEAERAEVPILLSNGNLEEAGDVPETTRHYAIWDDPFAKPCYLFALVGGDLGAVHDRFITASGREVALAIYVEKGKEPLAGFAMEALKRSMLWDETAFGREYDLDVFNIVAVSDFNMGAMENKGLNVFNDKYILASPDTATDTDYVLIEAIIAHEYFHNWTGNRITCRDWFQLCLKEGLTVFRDQEFTADMRSRPVKRIRDVAELRARQFPEDGGPLAHPVRPSVYKEINNFYTATVYEKGAEIIRMLKVLIGDDAFRAGMDLYFTRHDGEATTVEAFIACFAEASGRDLTHFFAWYGQAGTPVVTVTSSHDASRRELTLQLAQHTPATPGHDHKRPLVVPIRLGIVGEQGDLDIGDQLQGGLFVLDAPAATLTLRDIDPGAVPSLLRGFSAPVKLVADLSDEDLLLLSRRDSDSFNRWQALQSLATRLLVRSVEGVRRGEPPFVHEGLATAYAEVLDRSDADPAFAALSLSLPSEAEIAQEIARDVDPDAIHMARQALRRHLAVPVAKESARRLSLLANANPYSADAADAGRRSLRAALLGLVVAAGAEGAEEMAFQAFTTADNMTDRMAALAVLAHQGGARREEALLAFETRFNQNALVMDKWFALQASIPGVETLARVRRLQDHPAFTMHNPNRVRSLFGAFAANPTAFHALEGGGYALLGDTILALDPRNPQVAARLATAFRSWRMFEPRRRAAAMRVLERIAASDPLSRDVRDIVERTLNG